MPKQRFKQVTKQKVKYKSSKSCRKGFTLNFSSSTERYYIELFELFKKARKDGCGLSVVSSALIKRSKFPLESLRKLLNEAISTRDNVFVTIFPNGIEVLKCQGEFGEYFYDHVKCFSSMIETVISSLRNEISLREGTILQKKLYKQKINIKPPPVFNEATSTTTESTASSFNIMDEVD